ncbi:hypothetical protein AAG570_005769 [Ranatra chinensis]|uniref:Uncharacterized protein n=1 Tax=Ranatra chinensis TaxID=642074 RepID=A0ABD0XYE3_9HEMI
MLLLLVISGPSTKELNPGRLKDLALQLSLEMFSDAKAVRGASIDLKEPGHFSFNYGGPDSVYDHRAIGPGFNSLRAQGFWVELTQNSPVVIGNTVTLTAQIHNGNGDTFTFKWNDDAIPAHKAESGIFSTLVGYTPPLPQKAASPLSPSPLYPWKTFPTQEFVQFGEKDKNLRELGPGNRFRGEMTKSVWNITYPPSIYGPGTYEVQVFVSKRFLFWETQRASIYINVTALLSGDIELSQNGTERGNGFVSNTGEVTHSISLSQPDSAYATRNGTVLRSYWFVNCAYQGVTAGLTFAYNYTRGDVTEQVIRALVVVSNETEESSSVAGDVPAEDGVSNDISATGSPSLLGSTATTPVPNTATTAVVTTQPPPPTLCPNESFIPFDPGKTYGYFQKTVKLRSPVSDVIVTGDNWLMHGAVTHLSVSCRGSGPYDHCVQIKTGAYNVTGKESCIIPIRINNCSIEVTHYFGKPKVYTFLIIIENSVSKTITRFGVSIYEGENQGHILKQPLAPKRAISADEVLHELLCLDSPPNFPLAGPLVVSLSLQWSLTPELQKHAQLSVIVVPISCSVFAIILVIFGVAYYIQSRSRFTVEVADFDFSQAANDTEYKTYTIEVADFDFSHPTGDDTEYKTFRERLRDAIGSAMVSAATRSQDDYTEDGVWSPSRKYGSMQ